jgi:hypothetical protein
MLRYRPGDRCQVTIGRLKRQMTVISRSTAFNRATHIQSVRLRDRRGTMFVEIKQLQGGTKEKT